MNDSGSLNLAAIFFSGVRTTPKDWQPVNRANVAPALARRRRRLLTILAAFPKLVHSVFAPPIRNVTILVRSPARTDMTSAALAAVLLTVFQVENHYPNFDRLFIITLST